MVRHMNTQAVIALLVAIACGVASGDIDLQRARQQAYVSSQLAASSSTRNYGVKTSRVLKGKNGLPVEPYPVEMGYKSARGSGSKKSGSGKRKGERSRKKNKGSDDYSEDEYSEDGYHKKKGGDKGTPKGDDSYDDDYDGDKPKRPKKDKGDKVTKGDKGGPKDDDDSNIRPGDEDKIIEEEINLNLRMAVRNGGGNIERHYDDLIDMTNRIADLALEGVVKKLRKKNRMLFLEVDVLDTEVADAISQDCPSNVPETDDCYAVTMTLEVEGRAGDVETFRGNMIDLFNSCTAHRVRDQVNPRSPLYIPFLEDVCVFAPTQAPNFNGGPTNLAPTTFDRGNLGGDDNGRNNVAVIVGPIAGGLVLLIIIGLVISRMRKPSAEGGASAE